MQNVPGARSSAPIAAVPRLGSSRLSTQSSSYRHVPTGSVKMGSSPSQSSLAQHSLPAHAMDRSHLLALQNAYTNPQMLEEQQHARTGYSLHATGSFAHSGSFAPLQSAQSSAGFSALGSYAPTGSPMARPTSFPSVTSFVDNHGAIGSEDSRGSSIIDPSPLLSNADTGINGGGGAAPISPSINGDPHKPVRRWLYDFPPALNKLFYNLDNRASRLVQHPLSTVGGLTTSLEEEILQSNEVSQQSRRAAQMGTEGEGELARRRSDANPLQRSLAITRRNKVLVFLALAYTALTTIELGVMLPLFLFFIGFDNLATQALFTVLCCAVFSQVFKRFVWRPRPWMASRAISVRKDLTSSFPSRAVTCAVVYGYMIAHTLYSPDAVPFVVLAPIVIVCAAGASLARIFVGAHYLSDCLAGFLLGCLCCAIGSGLNRAVAAGCASCADHLCYAGSAEQHLTFSNLASLNLASLFVVAGGAVLAVVLSSTAPLLFWQKSIPIFGLLTPLLAFRLVLLCPQHNSAGVALFRMRRPAAGLTLLAMLITVGALLLGKLVNKLIRLDDSTRQLAATEVELAASPEDEGALSEGLSPHGAAPVNASHRLLLQCSSARSMLWNLLLFLLVYAAIFVALAAWRIAEVTPSEHN